MNHMHESYDDAAHSRKGFAEAYRDVLNLMHAYRGDCSLRPADIIANTGCRECRTRSSGRPSTESDGEVMEHGLGCPTD
jgi:hypothetical protein